MRLFEKERSCMKKDNSKVENVALRWLRYSNNDIALALRLMNSEPSAPAHACWLCQQTAEKAIKAALVLEEIRFPRTHDLDTLLDMLPEGWAVKNEHKDLYELTAWTVNARYPGDWPEPTREDAAGAESIARSVYDSVAAEFERRGMPV